MAANIPEEDFKNGYTRGAEILVGILVILFMMVFAACMTPQKAVNYLKDKDLLDDTCAANYPVQEKFIKGDSVVTTDTLWGIDYQTDTLVTKDTVYITKTLPAKTIIRTITRTDTVIKRDIAQENALQDEVIKSRNEASTEKADKDAITEKYNALKDKWGGKVGIPWWWLLILAALIGLGARFKLFKFFNPFK
jgi:hypothetical protein